ncbi:unnamed protein product [Prunus armeniaca]
MLIFFFSNRKNPPVGLSRNLSEGLGPKWKLGGAGLGVRRGLALGEAALGLGEMWACAGAEWGRRSLQAWACSLGHALDFGRWLGLEEWVDWAACWLGSRSVQAGLPPLACAGPNSKK